MSIKVITRAESGRADDPKKEYIMRHVRSLQAFIRERPERMDEIVRHLEKAVEASSPDGVPLAVGQLNAL
jgi:hypothetical protein